MRGILVGLGGTLALVLALLAGLGLGLGVGPLAPGAPASWLYVAVARNDQAEAAREIEIIDVESGERLRFVLDGQAHDLALSRDRRTLYVGSPNGRVLEVDAVRGTPLGQIGVTQPGDVRRVLPLPDGRRLLVLTATGREAGVTIVDLATGREQERLSLGALLPGRPLVRGDEVLLPASGATSELLLRLALDPLGVRETLTIATTSATLAFRSPPAADVGRDGTVFFASPSVGILAALPPNGAGPRRDIALARPAVPRRVQDLQAEIVVATDGSHAHLCIGTAATAVRYVLSVDALEPERVGTECGRFAAVRDAVYLGVRASHELLVLDPSSGEVRRRLALTGLAWRLAY